MLEKDALILEVKLLDYISKKDNREVKGISITYGILAKDTDTHLGYQVDSAFVSNMAIFEKFKNKKVPIQAKIIFEITNTKYAPRVKDIILA